MLRRLFLSSIPLVGSGLSGCLHQAPVERGARTATTAEFDDALASAIRSNDIDASRLWKELEFRDRSVLEAQTSMSGRRSTRAIHTRAVDLIMSAEISSRRMYEQRYRQPEWPGGRSGVTIGIGYDLGFVRPKAFAKHWENLLSASQVDELSAVCGLKGELAAERLAMVRHVHIDWSLAEEQFQRFLPFVIAETEYAFPNSGELSDMSLGALVSLVYNRGSNTNPNLPRRVHMYQCKRAMQQRQFRAIPGYIRDMKTLWQHERTARGLLIRRDLEADLFEAGLS